MALVTADPGALRLDPPDGYQYGDDHPWTPGDQNRLAQWLATLRTRLDDEQDQKRS